jgi:integrase/recombinase XerD
LAILKLLYYAGLRVSELCALTWRDVQFNDNGSAVLAVLGKGSKYRHVKISAEIASLLGRNDNLFDGGMDQPLFMSQKGGGLVRSQIFRIIKAIGKKARVAGDVSPHWLRHSHATHALNGGAPITLVRDTLGHSNVSVTNIYLKSNPEQSSGDYL